MVSNKKEVSQEGTVEATLPWTDCVHHGKYCVRCSPYKHSIVKIMVVVSPIIVFEVLTKTDGAISETTVGRTFW